MPLRLVVAYALIVLLASAGLYGLWVAVLRESFARRGRRLRRARRAEEAPRSNANGHQPAYETD
jgi:hypothetical protein